MQTANPRHWAALGLIALAQFMHRVGVIRNEPKSWKDYFFDDPATATGS